VSTGQPPEQPNRPEISVVEKNAPPTRRLDAIADAFVPDWEVEIRWTMPSPEAEADVKSYKIAIHNAQGQYVEAKDLCDGALEEVLTKKSCRLPMTTFWADCGQTSCPFGKDQGDLIRAKVQAINSKGSGSFSSSNINGARVEKVPHQMNIPDGVNSQLTLEVIITWDKILDIVPLNGGRDARLDSYSLEKWARQYTDSSTNA